jgi:hypothetical protein
MYVSIFCDVTTLGDGNNTARTYVSHFKGAHFKGANLKVPILKVPIPCNSDQCLILLHQPNARYQTHTDSNTLLRHGSLKYTILKQYFVPILKPATNGETFHHLS